ncbi:MAG: DUF1553 domain-containing protein, partial [Planctomycetota bacterium]
DQMIHQQVAGDLLPFDSDRERYDNLVATTFLMLGSKMLSERDKTKLTLDVVDEQIDTVGRAFLGMTLGCARCHDHKFDPIPTEDYYALAGIFRSTQTLNGESQKYVSTFNRMELPTSAAHRQAIADHSKQLKQLEREIKSARKSLDKAKRGIAVGIVVDDTAATKTGHWVGSTYSKGFIGAGYIHDDNRGDGRASVSFKTRLPKTGTYQVAMAFSPNANRAKNVAVQIKTLGTDSVDNIQTVTVDQRIGGSPAPWKTLGEYEFSDQSDAMVTISNAGTRGYVIVDTIRFINKDDSSTTNNDQRRANESASEIAKAEKTLRDLQQRRDELVAGQPPPIPTAMAPRDFPADRILDSPVHIRGEVRNLGEVVPRGFLQVCSTGIQDDRNRDHQLDSSSESSTSAFRGSGRLELAHWLTDSENPLVARVMVNRIWSKVFGEGLVRTVDNFGTRGQRPSHPKLLDAMAVDFIKGGWKLKPMIRRMVTSDAYCRSSDSRSNQQASLIDPENRLLWKAHRKRITAESLRDTMLSVAGLLTSEEPVAPVANKDVLATNNKGDSKAVTSEMDRGVRSIYLPIIRGNIDPLMTVLDAANPDLLVGKRTTTNVPAQALVLLNSKPVNVWADATAKRLIKETYAENIDDSMGNVSLLIQRTYQRCLSRSPTAAECGISQSYLRDQANNLPQRLSDIVAAIFASTEFRLLD